MALEGSCEARAPRWDRPRVCETSPAPVSCAPIATEPTCRAFFVEASRPATVSPPCERKHTQRPQGSDPCCPCGRKACGRQRWTEFARENASAHCRGRAAPAITSGHAQWGSLGAATTERLCGPPACGPKRSQPPRGASCVPPLRVGRPRASRTAAGVGWNRLRHATGETTSTTASVTTAGSRVGSRETTPLHETPSKLARPRGLEPLTSRSVV